MPPNGTLNGHAAWFLKTALAAIQGDNRSPTVSTFDPADALLGTYIDRVVHWREIHNVPQIEWTVAATAEGLGLTAETLLIWLRSGMPYSREGDWATGAGFLLVPSWVIDWQAKLMVLNKLFGNTHTTRQLALE
jgi:hypothetical protein